MRVIIRRTFLSTVWENESSTAERDLESEGCERKEAEEENSNSCSSCSSRDNTEDNNNDNFGNEEHISEQERYDNTDEQEEKHEDEQEDEDNNNDIVVAETSVQKWQRRRAVAIYMITLTFLYADMNLLAPNLTDIGNEFGFDEDERDRKLGGDIAVAFFLVGAPVSFLIGWLADSYKRAPLFAVTVFFGELACFITYFTTTYTGLFVCRVLTGISVGGALPIIYSVLGDLYKAMNRAAIAAVISTGTGIGIALGHSLAGFLGNKYGWRLPFLIVSVPSFICALIVLTVPEPERGGKEAARLEIEMERRRIIARLNEEENSPNGVESITHNERNETREIHAKYLGTDTYQRDETIEPNEKNDRLEIGMVRPRSVASLKDTKKDDSSDDVESATHNEEFSSAEVSIDDNEHNGDEELQSHHPEADGEDKDEATESDGNNDLAVVSWKSTLDMLRTPSVILLLLQGAPGALPFGMTAVFLNDYLAEDRGMTKEEATGVIVSFGAGNAIGVILGGMLGHWSYRRDVRYPPVIMGICLILTAIPMWFLINDVDEDSNKASVAAIAIFTGLLAIVPIPIERAILANVTLPERRGRANSFLGIVDDLGKGLGPLFVSLLIDAFDRRTAFNVSIIGWIIGGILSCCLFATVKHDEMVVQLLVRESLERG